MSRTCPACGSPHDTWGGLAVHLWKKEDDDHAHVKSKDDGLIWLSKNGHMAGDTSSTGGGDTTTDTGAGGSGSTLEVPTTDDGAGAAGSVDTADTDPSCPGCDRGTDSGPVWRSQHYLREAGDRLPRETAEAIDQHNYVCTECWKGFDA